VDEHPTLFPEGRRDAEERASLPSRAYFESSVLLFAIGDALGWPTEFLRPGSRQKLAKAQLREFAGWKKRVGGRFWGYVDEISPGEYSDDTQLTLSVARCIDESGRFSPDAFAYSELPLWLQYERGGGRSVKTAARNIIRPRVEWWTNFYKTRSVDYRGAGANGAAMRSLPIALANVNNREAVLQDVFRNAIVTHGHPRAIVGSALFALAVRHLLIRSVHGKELLEAIGEELRTASEVIASDDFLARWKHQWDEGRGNHPTFDRTLSDATNEAAQFLMAIPQFRDTPAENYYKAVGALDPATRGSGVGSVCCAIYLASDSRRPPAELLYTAANMLGSDTDTVAAFLGALLGARDGESAVPIHLRRTVQDHDYLVGTGARLHAIASSDQPTVRQSRATSRQEAYLRILAWEIGLHEMFWDAIDLGGHVVHPSLGRGTIIRKRVKPIARQNYQAKLVWIAFDSGQSCIFHSRVRDTEVTESLAKDIRKAIA
jgi:ADP-ribosylglycohydrolase